MPRALSLIQINREVQHQIFPLKSFLPHLGHKSSHFHSSSQNKLNQLQCLSRKASWKNVQSFRCYSSQASSDFGQSSCTLVNNPRRRSITRNEINNSFYGYGMKSQTRSIKTLVIPLDSTKVPPSEIKGRDLLEFSNWTRDDIFTILWIAVELKQRSKEAAYQNLCEDKTAILFYEDIFAKTGIMKGVVSGGGIVSSIHTSHLPLKQKMGLRYFARSLSAEADAIFIQSSQLTLDDLNEISTECYKPVINIQSAEIAPLSVLAELLTMFEFYGYLRRLTVAYLGPVDNPTLRTYISLFPKIGMHFRYASEQQVPHELWNKGVQVAANSKFKTDFQQMSSGADAIFRARVITTFYGDGEDKTGDKLRSRDMEEAELDWTFYHHNIHQGSCCADELLKCKQSMVWNHLENLQWISKALLVGLATSFKPKIVRPGFQGLAG